MDKEDFKKYIFTNIVRIYVDVADIEGKYLIMKYLTVAPGATTISVQGSVILGFILIMMSQTQHLFLMEQTKLTENFRRIFGSILTNVALDCLEFGKPIDFPPYLAGLFVFGGKDPMTGIDRYQATFKESLSQEKSQACWESVGSTPPTCVCLKNPKVVTTLVIQTRRIGCRRFWSMH